MATRPPRLFEHSNRACVPRCCARVLLVAVLAITCRTAPARADDSSRDLLARLDDAWRWAVFTVEDGLPSNSIEHVIESGDGTHWVATTRGLAWYDGFWWQPVLLPGVAPQERITHVVPGPRDEIFAVCRYALYCGGRNGFRRVPVELDGKPGAVIDVAPLPGDDDFLVQMSFNTPADQLVRRRAGKFQRIELPPEENPVVSFKLWPFPGGRVFLSTPHRLYRWNGNGWDRFFTLAADHANLLKLAENAGGTGILQYADLHSNLSTWTWQPGEAPRDISRQVNEYLQAVDVTDSGDLIAAFQSGVIRAGPAAGPWRVIPGLRSPRAARALCWSPQSGIWVGSENGLLYFRANPQRWKSWQAPVADGRNRVHLVLPRRDGTTWLGTADGIVILASDGSVTSLPEIEGTRLGLITAIAEDGAGHVWIGSGASFDGAWRFDGNTWRHFGPSKGLPASRVHNIYVNRNGQALFLAVHASYRFDANDDPGVFLFTGDRFEPMVCEDGRSLGRVYDACEGPDGTMWFATAMGLARRRGETWTWWRHAEGLVDLRVYTVAVTPDGRAWIGHEKQSGLGFVDVDDRVQYVEQINDQDRHFVSDLAVAPDGALWVAKDGAICRYQDGTWSTFGLAEGLPAAQVWSIAVTPSEALVGMLGAGLARLQLEALRGPPPQVRIHEPIVDHQVALLRWRAQTHRTQVHPENVETRYRLNDEPWTPWSRLKEAKLTDLLPGRHRLQVQAHGLLTGQLSALQEIAFTVEGPFYRRVEFLGPFGGLAAVSLIIIAIQGKKRRRHQRALRESEQIFRQLTENIRDVFWLRDCETGRILYVSPAHEAIWGDSEDVLYNDPKSWTYRIHPEDRDRVVAAFLSEQRKPVESAIEYRIITADGKTRWIMDRGFPIRDEHGRVVRIAGIAENITDRKEAEIAQQRATRQLQDILDNATAVIYVKDLEGRYLLINSYYEKLFNVSRQAIIGRTDYDVFPPEFAERFRANDQAALRAGEAITIEEQALHDDGVHDYISVKFPLFDADGKPYATCGISTDISLLKRTEETLRRQAIAFDTIADALLMIDIERRITDVNPACERMFGYARNELIGQPISMLLSAETAQALMPRIRHALDTRHRWNGEVCHLHKDGHAVLGDVSLVAVLDKSGTRIGSIAVVRDVTEKRLAEQEKARLEAQLRHVQRIETIGRLTSNVSHDFSNLLTGILLNTALARKTLDETHAATPYINAIEDAALQARGVTGTLLNFAHRTLADFKPVDLAAALAPTIRLLKRLLEPHITVHVDMPPTEAAWTVADETLLQQAVMNLGINARDAMPNGGTLQIKLTKQHNSHPEAGEESGELQLVVTDTGVGMSPEVLSRAFEPFFTTKSRGEGTGLGLPSVQSIVHSHNGRIHIESTSGRGTSVYITLPACAPAPRPRFNPVAAPVHIGRDSDTVLVVEDNSFVRSIIVSAIRAAGYEAIPAGDGEEALRVAQPGVTRLLGAVVDLDLPQRDGDHVIEDLRAVYPNLPVIRMTGRAEVASPEGHGRWLLRKPFQMSEFVDLLQRVMK
ncbi:MAG: hypothetical protein DCC66_06780 [Planctomycetota bacterium]|nr:MAG: hypothetical protein DCC66_06780 [Planctomycetota bacterium]